MRFANKFNAHHFNLLFDEKDTDDVDEGISNLYYTAQRVIDVITSTPDIISDLQIDWGTLLNGVSMDDIPDGLLYQKVGTLYVDSENRLTHGWNGSARVPFSDLISSSDAAGLVATHTALAAPHSDIVLNNAHRGGSGADHSGVASNTLHRLTVSGNPHNIVASNIPQIGTNTGLIGTNTANILTNDGLIAANTLAIGANNELIGTNITAIGLNTAHRGVVLGNPHNVIAADIPLIGTNSGLIATNITAIGLNTVHRSSDGTDHSSVVSNNAHRSGDGSDHADVATNTAGVSANLSTLGTHTTAIGLNTVHRTASTGADHSYIDQDVKTTASPTFNNLSLTGDLLVQGDAFTIETTTVLLEDNIIVLNKNQTGTPLSTLLSGFETERGDETNFQAVFQESDDSYRIGFTGDLQAVATREDGPTSTGIPFWNATANRFDTSSGLKFDGTDLILGGSLYLGATQLYGPTDGNLVFKSDLGMYFDIDVDSDGSNSWYWRGSGSSVVMKLSEAGILTLESGATITSADEDLTFTFGRAMIASPATDIAYFGHRDNVNTASYGFRQDSNGQTLVNAKTGTAIYLSINNATIASINSTGLAMASGKTISSASGNLIFSSAGAVVMDTTTGYLLDTNGYFRIRDADDSDVNLFYLDTTARTLVVGSVSDYVNNTFYGSLTMASGGDILFTDSTNELRSSIDTSNIIMSGGNASNVGGNLALFGSTHATLANRMRYRASGTEVVYWDVNGQTMASGKNIAMSGASTFTTGTGLSSINGLLTVQPFTGYTESNTSLVNGSAIIRSLNLIPDRDTKGTLDIEMSGELGGADKGSSLTFSYNKTIYGISNTTVGAAISVRKSDSNNGWMDTYMDFHIASTAAWNKVMSLFSTGLTMAANKTITLSGTGYVDAPTLKEGGTAISSIYAASSHDHSDFSGNLALGAYENVDHGLTIRSGADNDSIIWFAENSTLYGAQIAYDGSANQLLIGTMAGSGVVNAITIARGSANVAVAGTLTATHFGGIASANLVDKSAAESITGNWSFAQTISIYSSEATKTDWRFTINTNDADNMAIYAYDSGEATYKNILIGGANPITFTGTTGAVNIAGTLTTAGQLTVGGILTFSSTNDYFKFTESPAARDSYTPASLIELFADSSIEHSGLDVGHYYEGSVLLTNKYAQLGAANTFDLGQTITDTLTLTQNSESQLETLKIHNQNASNSTGWGNGIIFQLSTDYQDYKKAEIRAVASSNYANGIDLQLWSGGSSSTYHINRLNLGFTGETHLDSPLGYNNALILRQTNSWDESKLSSIEFQYSATHYPAGKIVAGKDSYYQNGNTGSADSNLEFYTATNSVDALIYTVNSSGLTMASGKYIYGEDGEIVIGRNQLIQNRSNFNNTHLYNTSETDHLFCANEKYTVSSSGTWSSFNAANMFDNNFDSHADITANSTGTFEIEMATGTSFISTYGTGIFAISFYYTYVPDDVQVWKWGKDDADWVELSFLRYQKGYSSSQGVWLFTTTGNYHQKFKVSITAQSDRQAWITSVEFHPDRPTTLELSAVSKILTNNYYGNNYFKDYVSFEDGSYFDASGLTLSTALTDAQIASAATWSAKAPTASPTFTGTVSLPATVNMNAAANKIAFYSRPTTDYIGFSGYVISIVASSGLVLDYDGNGNDGGDLKINDGGSTIATFGSTGLTMAAEKTIITQVGTGATSIPTWAGIVAGAQATYPAGMACMSGTQAIYFYHDSNGSNLPKIDAYDYNTSSGMDFYLGGNGGDITVKANLIMDTGKSISGTGLTYNAGSGKHIFKNTSSSYGSMQIIHNSTTASECSINFRRASNYTDAQSWTIGQGCWGNGDDFVIGGMLCADAFRISTSGRVYCDGLSNAGSLYTSAGSFTHSYNTNGNSTIYNATFENTANSSWKNILKLSYSIGNTLTSATRYIGFYNAGGMVGYIHSGVVYGTFTGCHDSQTHEDNSTWKLGMLVSSIGTIIGTPEMGRALPNCELTKGRKDKRVFGVYNGGEDPSERGDLMDQTKDALFINALGEGMILVCDSNGDIDNGDYICSSPNDGYGEKQDDDLLHNYTAAKATVSVNWDEEEYTDENFKYKLIPCTYHCG